MSSKPENAFIRGVHAHLPKVYFEKMSNPWRSGTADVWYSGAQGDLWIEYKYVPKVPQRTSVTPNLSPRQLMWLSDRSAEGRQVVVVVGHPKGGVIWHRDFSTPKSPAEFLAESKTRSELAAWIMSITGESPCRSRSSYFSQSESFQ